MQSLCHTADGNIRFVVVAAVTYHFLNRGNGCAVIVHKLHSGNKHFKKCKKQAFFYIIGIYYLSVLNPYYTKNKI